MISNSLLKFIPLVAFFVFDIHYNELIIIIKIAIIKKADGFDYVFLEESETFFYKHLVILCVIFFFFIFERTMKIITMIRTRVGYLQKFIYRLEFYLNIF